MSRRFHLFSLFTAGCGLLLVVAGASVTSTGSALAVPDWPLSYGRLMPPMTGGVFFEHGHRMLAAFVGALTLVLTVWARAALSARSIRLTAYAAFGAVCVQGLLGGITVLYQLPKPVSIAHACLGQTFFCLLVSLAWMSSSRRDAPSKIVLEPETGARFKALAWSVVGLFFVQLVLGAAFRHSALTVWPHLVGACLAAPMALVFCFLVFRAEPRLIAPATALFSLLFVQLALGLSAYLTWSPILTTAHVACGAALLASSVVAALELTCPA